MFTPLQDTKQTLFAVLLSLYIFDNCFYLSAICVMVKFLGESWRLSSKVAVALIMGSSLACDSEWVQSEDFQSLMAGLGGFIKYSLHDLGQVTPSL